jgi:hypothetical protein
MSKTVHVYGSLLSADRGPANYSTDGLSSTFFVVMVTCVEGSFGGGQSPV